MAASRAAKPVRPAELHEEAAAVLLGLEPLQELAEVAGVVAARYRSGLLRLRRRSHTHSSAKPSTCLTNGIALLRKSRS